MRRRALLMGGKQEPNTIIGGVGSVITTKSALATKLGISESIIKRFEVVGNDVHCIITNFYNIPINCFNGDSNITSFIDKDGRVTSINNSGLRNCPNLANVKFDNAELHNSALSNNENLYNLDYGGHLIIRGFWSIGGLLNSKIKSLHITDGNVIYNTCLRGTSELEIVTSNNPIVEILNDAFNNSGIKNIDAENITLLGNRCFMNSRIEELNLYSLTIVPAVQFVSGCSFLRYLRIPLVESIIYTTDYFRGLSLCELISMKKLKTLGDATTVDTSTFLNLKLNCTIQVHEDMSTSNAGNANATLQWAKTNRSATVEFYDDAGNYVSTL